MPNFTKAFEYICVHTGGRAVIDAMEHNLALPPHYLEPSRLSLYRYGNVSSASIWCAPARCSGPSRPRLIPLASWSGTSSNLSPSTAMRAVGSARAA